MDRTLNISSQLSNKKVLITGGAGMIGSTLARMAACCGAEVQIVDAMLPLYGGNLFNLSGSDHRIDFVQGDIRDSKLMEQLVEDVDFIFDLAAQVSYVESNRDPLLDLDINCKGHLSVLEACRKRNQKTKLVFSSSRFVYGATKYNPVDEDHPTDCKSIYGIHKLTAEKYFYFYNAAYGLDTVCVRIANPYGPRQQMKHNGYGIVNWFIRLAMEGRPLTIFGDGLQMRDYVFVEDVARGLLAVAVAPETKAEVYNLGSGVGTSFRKMVEIVAECLPKTEIREVPWPAERYFVETGDYVCNLSKIRSATAWEPQVELREGIERTIAFYAANKQHYW
jgi:UDP-glucose 4-epimerase